jgi:two-component system, NarL family, invasion response regulator UvrY
MAAVKLSTTLNLRATEASVLIADPSALVRMGVAAIMHQHWNAGIEEASTAAEALEAVSRAAWNLIVADINLARSCQPDLVSTALDCQPGVPILILASLPNRSAAQRALQAGARGYIWKSASMGQVAEAIDALLHGKRYISPDPAREPSVADEVESIQERLSIRELQVMLALASGKTASSISADLSISVKSVSTYRTRLLLKLGLTNNMDLMRCALQHGLI